MIENLKRYACEVVCVSKDFPGMTPNKAGAWLKLSEVEEALRSTSHNTERDEICPKCQGVIDAIKWHCPICEENYEYGRYGNPGKLSPVS